MDWAAILRLNFGTFCLMWVFQKISQQVCHWIALLAYTWWKQSGQLFDWHPLQLGIWEWVLPCHNFDAQLIYHLQVSCLSTPWLAGMCSLMKHEKCLQKCSTPTVSTILRHITCMGSCSGHATTTSICKRCLSKFISLRNIGPSLGKRRLAVILMLLTSSWCVHSYLPQHLALWCQRNASFFKKTLSHPISALKYLRPLLLWLKTFLFLFVSHLQMLCCLSTHTHFEVLLSSHWYTSFTAHFQHSILFSFIGNNYNFDFCSLQHIRKIKVLLKLT